jgi:hypothetical protein
MPVAGKATTATSLTTITGIAIKSATNIATTTRITIVAEPASSDEWIATDQILRVTVESANIERWRVAVFN